MLKELYDGRLHWRANVVVAMQPSPSPALLEIWARYIDAIVKADEAYAAEIAQTPIDDEAWGAALEWRANCGDPRYDPDPAYQRHEKLWREIAAKHPELTGKK